jgi:hypothetical protein
MVYSVQSKKRNEPDNGGKPTVISRSSAAIADSLLRFRSTLVAVRFAFFLERRL